MRRIAWCKWKWHDKALLKLAGIREIGNGGSCVCHLVDFLNEIRYRAPDVDEVVREFMLRGFTVKR